MLLNEKKQRKIFDMFRAETYSIREIGKRVNVSPSSVQQYKKIYETLISGKPLPSWLHRTFDSSRIERFKSFFNENQTQQPYTPRRRNPSLPYDRSRNILSPTTDALVSNQQIALLLSRDLEQSEQKNKELQEQLKQTAHEKDNIETEKQQLLRQLQQKNQENEELKQTNAELINRNKTLNLENQDLKKNYQDTMCSNK